MKGAGKKGDALDAPHGKALMQKLFKQMDAG
jgi:hypothetical protein